MNFTYAVTVEYYDPHTDTYRKTILTYFSEFSACYLAKRYAKCIDVNSVEVTNNGTGEVLYVENHATGEYYEA